MRNHAVLVAGIVLAMSAGGCVPRAATRGLAQAELQPTPRSLTLAFASDLADEYRVLAGPAETYRGLDVNARARAGFQRLAGAAGAPSANLRIRVLAFEPGYRQLGSIGDSGHRPEEVRKTGTLRVQAAVEREGQVLGERMLSVHAASVWRWDDASSAGSPHDFGEVLDQAVARAVEAVDTFVGETLGAKQ